MLQLHPFPWHPHHVIRESVERRGLRVVGAQRDARRIRLELSKNLRRHSSIRSSDGLSRSVGFWARLWNAGSSWCRRLYSEHMAGRVLGSAARQWKRGGLAALANERKGRGRNSTSELAALAICQLLWRAVSVYLEKEEWRERNETSPNKGKWK